MMMMAWRIIGNGSHDILARQKQLQILASHAVKQSFHMTAAIKEFQSTERRPCWCTKTYPVRVDLFSYVIKHFFLFQYMCMCSEHVNARIRALNCPITLSAKSNWEIYM